MIRPEHLAALGDLGYNERESRFLYLVATHSGYFTLRQFLDYTGTSKGWNVHQFTSKSIQVGHVRAASCGYRTSVFNLYSRKVYGALDRDNLRNRGRLSSELIQTRLLILDFVLAHQTWNTSKPKRRKPLHRPTRRAEALIPGRVYRGSSRTPRRRDASSIGSQCSFLQDPTVRSENRHPPCILRFRRRGLFHYVAHLRSYEHSCGGCPAFASSMPPQVR